MENAKYLHNIHLFASLDEDDLARIANLASERYYPKESIIFFEGEPGEAFFFLKSGRVKISKITPEGGEQILKLIEPGAVFAEAVIFSDEAYPATARVLEDACVGMIKKKDFEALIMEQPELAIRLLKLLNKRLREAQMKIKELGLFDAHSRTASLLLRLAQTYGKEDGDKISFQLKLNRQDLANMIGTTRETITRILSKFRRQGIIELEGDRITILKPSELESWINIG
ncbi:hypothetical protein BBF96_05995 [Anoxybacter fermentans]|uniref:cAMP-binding protein n=1 Tax=Anoxybacter fermentans TaxID=1323375 RepID=A0A3S9SXP1_9FIRM|nr:Crp/Fnr family transcriptional regulator [Anoxybacter fermentans]AZR72984.1 hypothetical protein BBF96_05995 [Anoxybacter fermentans]